MKPLVKISSIKKHLTAKNYAIASVVIVISLILILRLQPDEGTHNLTTPPAKSIVEEDDVKSKSVFSLSISAPLIDLNDTSNQVKVRQIKGIDDGPRECSEDRDGKRDCYTTKYHYTISSGSPSIVPGVDKTINVSIPVFISGRGSQIGRSENRSNSDIRYFQSKLIASANIKVSLDSKWCPRINIQPEFLWKDSTKVEVFHKAKIDLQYMVEKRLRDPLINMGSALVKDFVSCERIRGILRESWNQVSFPINKPDSPIQQFINIEPVSLGYAGLKLLSEKLSLEYRITTLTEVTEKRIIPETRQLPSAALAASDTSIAYLPVPFGFSYREILSEIHKQIGSEPFFTRNRFGEHLIHIKKINIYPSDNKLIIGLQVHITNSEDWLDKTGWVHIITEPKLINTGDGIILSNPKFAEGRDPDEWITVKRALKESILETIEQRGLIINFNEAGKNLLKAMKNELEKPRSNIPVLFTNPEFRISNISLLNDSLAINGALGAEASFISEGDYEVVAQSDMDTSNPDMPIDPALERIQIQMERLLRQIDGLESKLDHFRQILNN